MNTTHSKTLIISIGVALGIVVGEISMYASEVFVVGIILIFVQSGLYLLNKKNIHTRGTSFLISITILFCIGLVVGIVREQFVEKKMSYICVESCTFDARIISSPHVKNDMQEFIVEPLQENLGVLDVTVRVPLYPKYTIGETLTLSGKVTQPNAIFPHGDALTKRTFDYTSFLETKNVGSEIAYPHVLVLDTEAHTVTDYLGRWKEDLIERSNMYVTSPAAELATGMLFGATSIDKETIQTFRVAGLSHIIVLSGFNIAIVITSILFVLTFFPLFVRVGIAAIFTCLFVMMVGGEASVVRATLMAFIGLLALLVGREYVAKQALLLSFLGIILYNPTSLLYDVSLHLSFLATAGIIYMSGFFSVVYENYFSKITLITSKSFRELCVTTLSAYCATLPYIMYTFGTVSVYALLANILVLPLVPLAMLLSFFVVVSTYTSSLLASIFGFLDTVLISIMLWIARAIEVLPFSSFTLTVSFFGMCFFYFAIMVFAKYFLVKSASETRDRYENGVLTDIISY